MSIILNRLSLGLLVNRESRQLTGPVTIVLLTCLVLALGTAVLVAVLWIMRNLVLTGYDVVGHMATSLQDTQLLRAHAWGSLRDQFFLYDRWEPPGIRILGLLVGAVFWTHAEIALRLSSTVLFVLTDIVLFVGLRRLVQTQGAAVGALGVALAPALMLGAQDFMTESVLQLCGATTIALVIFDTLSERGSFTPAGLLRLSLLGLFLGWGALTKLTFLPAMAPIWLGAAAFTFYRTRNTAELLTKIMIPVAGILLVAWPAYVINAPRWLSYAQASAEGFGYTPWSERGFAFTSRAISDLVSNVWGPAGAAILVAGFVLTTLAWRRLTVPEQLFVCLCIIGSLPAFSAFFLSHNQTDRYLVLNILLLSVPVAIGFAQVFKARLPLTILAAGLAAGSALVQVAAVIAIAFGSRSRIPSTAGISDLALRPNYPCDYSALAKLTKPADGPVRIGTYGSAAAMTTSDVALGYLHAAVPAKVIELTAGSAKSIAWERVREEVEQLDYIVLPRRVGGARDTSKTNQTLDMFHRNISAWGLSGTSKIVVTGPPDVCTIELLWVRSPYSGPGRRPPIDPEIYLPGWSVPQ